MRTEVSVFGASLLVVALAVSSCSEKDDAGAGSGGEAGSRAGAPSTGGTQAGSGGNANGGGRGGSSAAGAPIGSGGNANGEAGGNANGGNANGEAGGKNEGPACGNVECPAGETCCNASCSLCAPPNGSCIQIVCDPGPTGGKCTLDTDCRLFDDYCTGCDCRALSKPEPDPTCDGPGVRCLVAPCENHVPACYNGRCVARTIR